MSQDAKTDTQPETHDDDGKSVGNLELFFDLVFVYAMSQVTELMLTDVSWRGFGHGALGLTAVWWAWVCFAWLTNAFTKARVASRYLILGAMAAMLLAASALPTAFSDGALVFGVALLVVRVIHLAAFSVAASHDDDLRSNLLKLAPSLLAGPVLVVIAAAVPTPYRELLWVSAALIDLGGPLVAGVGGFQVVPSYFVERHGNIIIIVLGEAIIGLGAGASEQLHRPAVLVAAVLGVAIAASLWWTYFGLTTGAEQRLQRAHGAERAQLARDAYSYTHLPLVCGVGLLRARRPRNARRRHRALTAAAGHCPQRRRRDVLRGRHRPQVARPSSTRTQPPPHGSRIRPRHPAVHDCARLGRTCRTHRGRASSICSGNSSNGHASDRQLLATSNEGGPTGSCPQTT